MVSLGEVSARVFGADPVLRGYLRHVLLEDSAANAELFGRLLSGARAEVERLSEVYGEQEPDEGWAPFQTLCLILGPLLLERVMQPNLDEPMFGSEALARRSEANQQLLLRGHYGHLEEVDGGSTTVRYYFAGRGPSAGTAWATVSAGVVPLAFLLAAGLRRLPGFRRVL
ncbi:hypothetical protein ACFY3M_41050 [Streptomyces mirabilis]|uniref:hypothetical protein n=1 Tax=Streptomyces mirabilis TaxID=68239 RepID=UPI00369F8542